MTYDELQAFKKAYEDVATLDIFDLPANHGDRLRKRDAHIAYLKASAAYTGVSQEALIEFYYGTQEIIPPLNERAPTWYERMKAREGHWAAKAAQQFGPLPEPEKVAFLDIKGARAWAKARKEALSPLPFDGAVNDPNWDDKLENSAQAENRADER